MDRFQRLIDGAEGFDRVSIHPLPDGGVEILLHHKSTMDNAALIRVPIEGYIRFMYDDPVNEEAVKRTNEGGPWDEARFIS